MLLSDPSVRKLLQDTLIPCWESVQDPAEVTIRFANGEEMLRTIGGNTVIYLCRRDGAVVDALPGVYTPQDFFSESATALALLAGPRSKVSDASLAKWHRQQIKGLTTLINGQLVTISKGIVESPLLNGMVDKHQTQNVHLPPIPKHSLQPPLRDASKEPASAKSIRNAYLPPEDRRISPQAFGRHMVALDSANNVRVVRPMVHRLLANYPTAKRPNQCQRALFEDLMGVPLSDPYMGFRDALLPGTPRSTPDKK